MYDETAIIQDPPLGAAAQATTVNDMPAPPPPHVQAVPPSDPVVGAGATQGIAPDNAGAANDARAPGGAVDHDDDQVRLAEDAAFVGQQCFLILFVPCIDFCLLKSIFLVCRLRPNGAALAGEWS